MKIIKPYAKMLPPAEEAINGEMDTFGFSLNDGIRLLKHVEWCARISHRSEDAVTNDSWKRILKSIVLDHGDWSVTEHASVTVDAYVDRGITHEWVRHRMGAYTQESTRFVNYEKKMAPSFVLPEQLNEPVLMGRDDLSGNDKRTFAQNAWRGLIEHCESTYRDLLSYGYPPQIARSVFPNALASRLIVTYNLRNWRHFFIMRTCKESHPQMREVTLPLLKEFQEKIPLLYDDIIPEMKQSEAMKKAR